MDTNVREKAITNTSIVGIIANVLLTVFKVVAGTLAGSIAIVLDGVNSLTDGVSSVVTILGVKLSHKRPDKKHPFGYGRVEYFSTVIVAAIVLAAGVLSGIESVKSIMHPELPDYQIITVVVIGVSILAKIFIGRFFVARGHKFNSDALKASGVDATMDAVLSASTLLGVAAAYFFRIAIEGYLGIIISGFIIKAGIEMLLDAANDMLGRRPDSSITSEIKAAVKEIPGVLGAYDLILHNYGPEVAIGSIHVEIPSDMDADGIHHLTEKIQAKILEKFHVFVTVGIYAVEVSDPHKMEIRQTIHDLGTEYTGVVNTHGIHVEDDVKTITFDVTLDFSVKDKEAFAKEFTAKINEHYPDYMVYMNFDTDYTD